MKNDRKAPAGRRLRFAVAAALSLLLIFIAVARYSDSGVSVALHPPGDSPPPYPKDCHVAEDYPESLFVANETLGRRSDDLVFDRYERDRLAAEVEEVLVSVRDHDPRLAHVWVLPEHGPMSVTVGLSAELMDQVIESTGGREFVGAVETGIDEVDALNARLGLRGFQVFPRPPGGEGSLSLCLDDRVNLPRAAERYEAIDGVRYAETGGILSIGPRPEMALDRAEDGWYVVALRGIHCRPFCVRFDTRYFKVTGVQAAPPSEPYRPWKSRSLLDDPRPARVVVEEVGEYEARKAPMFADVRGLFKTHIVTPFEPDS